jgi:hypothetical protein
MQRSRIQDLIDEISSKIVISGEYEDIPLDAAKILAIRNNFAELKLDDEDVDDMLRTLSSIQLCEIYFKLTENDCMEPPPGQRERFIQNFYRDMIGLEFDGDTHNQAKLRAIASLVDLRDDRKLTSRQANNILLTLGPDGLSKLRNLI